MRIYTVRQAADGAEVLPGRPRVVASSVEQFGGVFDCRAGRWHDESANPVVWYLSQEQRDLAVHSAELPLKILCRAAEGAGKTRGVLAPWMALRAIEFAGQNVEIGGTAPTQARLETLRLALFERMPPDWYVWRQRDWLFRLHCGVQIRLVSAHRSSEAEGSPIQGYDWVAAGSDEGQDQLHIMDDIEARGRRAPGGRYRRMMAVSAKDSPVYRDFEDKWAKNPLCKVSRLVAFTNPFTAQEHWENLKRTLSAREYDRRVLAINLGPENATYHAWDRAENIRPVPRIGARDVTSKVLGGFHALIGHDPGSLYDVSLIIKCYEVGGKRMWWVVDEVTTKQTTTDQHVAALKERLQQTWQLQWPGADEPKVLVRCDPYGDNDNKTDRSVYTTFKLAGIQILSAAYNKHGEGRGRVPKDAAIDMVNGLMCSKSGERRLFVDVSEEGVSSAPMLVRAIETDKLDERGKAEIYRKGVDTDVSHWVAALRYALWPYERTRNTAPAAPREAFS